MTDRITGIYKGNLREEKRAWKFGFITWQMMRPLCPTYCFFVQIQAYLDEIDGGWMKTRRGQNDPFSNQAWRIRGGYSECPRGKSRL